MRNRMVNIILLSVSLLFGCSSSKYADPSKACPFYDQITYDDVKSFSYYEGAYHLLNQTTSFYKTTDPASLRKLIDCFKKGMSTLTKTDKTLEITYNDYAGPSFSFSTDKADYHVNFATSGCYFSSDPDLALYSTDFDFSSVFDDGDLITCFSYLFPPTEEVVTSYGEEITCDDSYLDKIYFVNDPAYVTNRYVDLSSQMVIKDNSEHVVNVLGADSFSYKQKMYKLSDGPSFESLLTKAQDKKDKRTIRVEFSSDFFLSIVLDANALVTKDHLLKIVSSMLVNAKKDRTALYSIYSNEERTEEVEDFSLSEDRTLYGVC